MFIATKQPVIRLVNYSVSWCETDRPNARRYQRLDSNFNGENITDMQCIVLLED